MPDRSFITVVSGLPRSGTSLMMQMLHAGGLPVMSDQKRTADEDNPRGYFEIEQVKQLKTNSAWLAEATGKAIKVIHMLLMDLPTNHEYRVIFMERDLNEVVRSQAAMLQRSGRTGANMPADRLMQVYAGQLLTVKRWLAERACFKTLDVHYANLIRSPADEAKRVQTFLGTSLDVSAMVAAVDPTLYRNRKD